MLDLDLDEEQHLGVVPAEVLGVLWPGFVPRTHEVFINPVATKRHMLKGPNWMYRVAAFFQNAESVANCLNEPHAFARFDGGINPGDAGVTVYTPIRRSGESTTFLAVGIRMFPRSRA